MILKFQDFSINELFDLSNIYNWDLNKIDDEDLSPSYTYKFKSDNNNYNVCFISVMDDGNYERTYYVTYPSGKPKSNAYSKTNEGVPLKIQATITDITLDFLSRSKYMISLEINPIDSRRYNIVLSYIKKYLPKNFKIKGDGKKILIERI